MAVLLQLQNAHKSYGDQVLLDGAEASIVDNLKVGFVGRNGAGKSTLLRVLLGDEELEVGEVIRHPSLRIGYLRQHDPFKRGESALDFLMRDSEQPDWKCGEVAGQFELKGAYLEGPVSELSGGWQTRVKLAALLLHDPNLLMLDEPTNFLDLRTQILLEHFLRGFKKAALIVSHDRGFLKATCSHTLDLTRGKLTMYPGKIDEFLVYQQERREHDRRVNATVASKQKQLQRFIEKNRANASTASQAKSKQKQLDRLQQSEIDTDEPTVHMRAPVVDPRQGPAIRCQGLSIGYPDLTVATDINIEIDHGERAAIVGDNGQGKTTLLRTLVGSLDALDGSLRWGFGCEIGTYAQHVYTSLNERQTVLEYLEYQAKSGTTNQQILAVAGSLLFRDAHVKKKISVLSGGERARLCMAGLLLGDYNIMVLDEPGNHLDVETVEALADALLAYRGTVIFTSHDRHFMSRVATSIVQVRDGHVRNYTGGYDAYLYAMNQEIDGSATERAKGKSRAPAGGPKPKVRDKSAQQAERKRRKTIQNIERKIAQLDDRSGGIGRRAGFKIQCPLGRVGSSPTSLLPEGAKEKSTVYGESIHRKHLLRHLGARKVVRAVTKADLQAYITLRTKDKWRGKNIRPETIKKEITTLRLVWNWSLEQQLVSTPPPTKGLVYPKTDEKYPFMTRDEIERYVAGLDDEEEIRKYWESLYLNTEEIRDVLRIVKEAATYEYVYPMVAIAAHTGARRSEIMRSRREDVDFQNGVIMFREKKGSKKNAMTFRRVEMSTLLAETLREWFSSPAAGFTFTISLRESPIWASQPVSVDAAQKQLKQTLKNTEWNKIRGFHTFRHSMASNMAAAGVQASLIDDFLGHQTEAMRRRYRHFFPHVRRQAISQVFDIPNTVCS